MLHEPEISIEGEGGGAAAASSSTSTGPDDSLLDPLSSLLQTQLWSSDSTIVAKALQELADMCAGDSSDGKVYEAKQAVYEGAGGFAVPVAMKRCHASQEVQVQGCRALYVISNGNSYFGSAAVKFGALSIVLFAMKEYGTYNATLVANAFNAIRSLHEADYYNAPLTFQKLQGAAVVMEAMTSWNKDTTVVLAACNLLKYLSSCGEGLPAALVDEGALEALGAASRKFKEAGNKEHDEIRDHAKNAINTLLSATS
jgi:hypothetical protein